MLPDHQTRQVRESAFIFTSLTIRGWIERQRQTRCLFPPFRTFLPHSSPSPHIKRVKRENQPSPAGIPDGTSITILLLHQTRQAREPVFIPIGTLSMETILQRHQTRQARELAFNFPCLVYQEGKNSRHQTHQVRAPAFNNRHGFLAWVFVGAASNASSASACFNTSDLN